MAERRPQTRPLTGHHALVYPTEYVKAADLKGRDVTVVIDAIMMEMLTMVGGKREEKAVVTLRTVAGKPLGKRLILNKTNLRSIAGVLSEPMVHLWPGGRVTLYPTTCRGGDGKEQECVRVRVRVNANAADVPEAMAEAPVPRTEFADEAGETEAGG